MTDASITVDTTSENVNLEFLDSYGNVTDAPDGATVTYVTAPDGIVTIDGEGNITPTGTAGSVNIGVSVTDASGAPMNGGSFDIDPASTSAVTIEVDPGAAVGDRLTVTSDVGEPTPPPTDAPPTTDAPPDAPPPDTTTPPDTTSPPPADSSPPSGDGSPGGSDPGPTSQLYSYSGNPNAIDPNQWSVAPYTDDGGHTLYYYTGPDPSLANAQAGFSPYLGTPQPVSPQQT